jgi:hypothetical protein
MFNTPTGTSPRPRGTHGGADVEVASRVAVDPAISLGVVGYQRPTSADGVARKAPLQRQALAGEAAEVAGATQVANRLAVEEEPDEGTVGSVDHCHQPIGHALHQRQRVDRLANQLREVLGAGGRMQTGRERCAPGGGGHSTVMSPLSTHLSNSLSYSANAWANGRA